MTKGITDPTTGKTYAYTGFAPARRVSDACGFNSHSTCPSSPEQLSKNFDFDFVKAVCCLCRCHFN